MNLDYNKFASSHSSPVGRPAVGPQSSPAKVISLCSKCLTEIGKGKSHQCYKSNKRANISEIVRNTSKKTKSKITASGLKSLADEGGFLTEGEL